MTRDVAYGTRKLKLDSGGISKIPQTILLTCKYSDAISTYMDISEKNGFEPVSEFSLWRILKEIKPSQQKPLAGTDNNLAAGTFWRYSF